MEELQSNLKLLHTRLEAEGQRVIELQRALAVATEQTLVLQSECKSLSDLVGAQTQQLVDKDQALETAKHDCAQSDAALQACKLELDAARQKKKKQVRYGVPSGPFTRVKRRKKHTPTDKQNERKEKAARLLPLIEIPFNYRRTWPPSLGQIHHSPWHCFWTTS